MREWSTDGNDVLIGEYWHGNEEDYSTTCMYSVANFTNDGLDDIATYCQTTGDTTGKQAPVATLYTLARNGPKKRTLREPEVSILKQALCEKAPNKKFCKR